MEAILDLIGSEFGRAGIPYLVVGGCAINLHGYSRHTDDVDILIDEKFADAAAACLCRHGYKANRYEDLFCRLVPESPLLVIVDLMFADSATVEKMTADSLIMKYGAHEHRIPSAKHLLAMKLHALAHGSEQRRGKDAQDVVELARISSLDIRSAEFRGLCQRFGNDAVLRYLLNLTAPFK
jgi:hypothetical protein